MVLIKKTNTGVLKKVSGPLANYFSNNGCGYIYPLWKTHKITLDNLKTSSIKDIPTRILHTAGNT